MSTKTAVTGSRQPAADGPHRHGHGKVVLTDALLRLIASHVRENRQCMPTDLIHGGVPLQFAMNTAGTRATVICGICKQEIAHDFEITLKV